MLVAGWVSMHGPVGSAADSPLVVVVVGHAAQAHARQALNTTPLTPEPVRSDFLARLCIVDALWADPKASSYGKSPCVPDRRAAWTWLPAMESISRISSLLETGRVHLLLLHAEPRLCPPLLFHGRH